MCKKQIISLNDFIRKQSRNLYRSNASGLIMDGTLVYCNTLYNDKFYCNFQLIDLHHIYTV